MLSYILNRQYKNLTECLPLSLQTDQPDTVYLPSYANPKLKQITIAQINNTTDIRKSNKLKMKKKAKVVESTSIGDCCPTCFSTENIVVKYHGKKHVCVNCRKFLRDQHGNQVKLFVNKQGDIVCLGIYKINDQIISTQQQQENTQTGNSTQDKKVKTKEKVLNKLNHKVYYHTDSMKLFWNGKRAFSTFAGEDEMIVLLRDRNNM